MVDVRLFIPLFIYLLVLLVGIKTVLVIYRVSTGKWPASVSYLLGIIEWKKEVLKILALVILACILTVFGVRL